METNATLKSIFYYEDGTPKELSRVIASLKEKSVDVPEWATISKSYDPTSHEIVTNKKRRPKDKKRGDVEERVARIVYPAEKNTVRRMTQMMFTLPVTRKYKCADEDVRKEINGIMEAVYKKVRIDGENNNRFKAYFAACEMMTVWYAVKEPNDDYGFHSNFKLRCRSYSPMPTKFSRISEAKLYPLFDEVGDLIALSFEYSTKVGNTTKTKFETFTADMHYRWVYGGEDGVAEDIEPEPIIIGKIPAAYIYRPAPIYEGIENNRDEIEFTLSRTSDVIRKNAHPIMGIVGELVDMEGDENKPKEDVARELYQLEEGGDIKLITPAVSEHMVNYFVGQLQKNIEEETQLPNLSLENTKGLGAMSGEARKTLLTDAHMKCGEEKHEVTSFLSREGSIIKSLLAKCNVGLESKLKMVDIEHEVHPFVMSDEDAAIKKAAQAAAGTRFASQKTLVELAGLVEDADAEMERIKQEEAEAAANSPINNLFDATE